MVVLLTKVTAVCEDTVVDRTVVVVAFVDDATGVVFATMVVGGIMVLDRVTDVSFIVVIDRTVVTMATDDGATVVVAVCRLSLTIFGLSC